MVIFEAFVWELIFWVLFRLMFCNQHQKSRLLLSSSWFRGFFYQFLLSLFSSTTLFFNASSDLTCWFIIPLKNCLESYYSLKFKSLVEPSYLKHNLFISTFSYNSFNMFFLFSLRSLNISEVFDWLFLSSDLSPFTFVYLFGFKSFKASTCFCSWSSIVFFVFQTLFPKVNK